MSAAFCAGPAVMVTCLLPSVVLIGVDHLLVGVLVERNARASRHLRAVTAAEAAENHATDGDGADDAEGAAEFSEMHPGPTQDAAGAGQVQHPADPGQAGEPNCALAGQGVSAKMSDEATSIRRAGARIEIPWDGGAAHLQSHSSNWRGIRRIARSATIVPIR